MPTGAEVSAPVQLILSSNIMGGFGPPFFGAVMQISQTEDPRDGLQRLRKIQLQRIIAANNIPVSIDAPAETLRIVIRDAMERGSINLRIQKTNRPTMDNAAKLTIPNEVKYPEIKQKIIEPIKEITNYSKLSRPTLMRICKQKGIKVSKSDKKQDLIAKLNG